VLTGKAISLLTAYAPGLWPLINRPVMRFFDGRASGWDDRTGAGSVEHLAPLAAAVLKVGRSPERILDIGCGTGAATLFLAREFPHARVRGVDISPAMISRARAKIGLDPEARVAFRQGDASSLAWPEKSFDLITLVNMPIFFREISRVLRPGGSVIVIATLGDWTPFSTPQTTVRKRFQRLGVDMAGSGETGAGRWYCGHRADGET
jgi:ubiquinone/menaquinone biosynthesis C-methylase UbiE